MRKKIGELLVEAGVVTEEQVRVALGRRGAFGSHRLGEVLVAQGLCTPTHIAQALSAQHALPFVALPEEIPANVAGLVSVDFQSEHRILPFRMEVEGRSERILVAVDDPADVTLVDELRFQLRKQMRVFVAASDDLDAALARARGEPLDIVEAVALEDEDGAPPPPVAAGAPLEWDFPEAPKPVPKSVPPSPPPAARPPRSEARLRPRLRPRKPPTATPARTRWMTCWAGRPRPRCGPRRLRLPTRRETARRAGRACRW